MEELKELVRACVQSALRDGAIDVDALATAIFARSGQKFIFVFNQNIRRTNAQVAELAALIQIHCSSVIEKLPIDRVDFTDFEYMKGILSDLVAEFNVDDDKKSEQLYGIVASYISNKVLLETYYGTAAVFLAPHLKLNVERVCGESGYIHSCGDLVLLRNATKASVHRFKESIHDVISGDGSQRYLLVPYCHEDFTDHDRGKSAFLTYGLDDIKLNLSKAYVGGRPLGELLDEIGAELPERIYVPPGGNYKDALKGFRAQYPSETPNTIWVISDADIVKGSRFPGDRKFYILYKQLYRNHNRYHLFDENKPGWASHTTLPHSLAGAMINLARAWMPKDQEILLADPFGGSGTTFFECQKFANVRAKTSDLAAIYEYVLDDNVKFFSMTASELDVLVAKLEVYRGAVPMAAMRGGRPSPGAVLHGIAGIVSKWSDEAGTDFLDLSADSLKAGMSDVGEELSDRIILYTALRASSRGYNEIYRGGTEWIHFFRSELEDIIEATRNYTDYIRGSDDSEQPEGRLRVLPSSYSPAIVPSEPSRKPDDLFNRYGFAVQDIRGMAQGVCDVIVTDPPYGFNTEEGRIDFAKFISEVVPILVGALKPQGGQLLLACPETSFSGRAVMPFVRADYLTREVIRVASLLGRECVVPAVGLPTNVTDMRPPYYWVAEKTLRRRVLHFWIRTRPN